MDTYRYEKDLVKDFFEISKKFLRQVDLESRGKRLFSVTEFDSAFGIADIVLGYFKKNVRLNAHKGLNPNWIYTLNGVNLGDEFTLYDFVKKFSISIGLGKKMVNHFEESGHFREKNEGVFVKHKDFIPSVEKIISIEAKLHNWRKALKQAYRYKRFSNQSFVLLPQKYAKSAKQNIAEFERYNIGLIILHEANLTICFTPKEEKVRRIDALAMINESALLSCRTQ